MITGPTLLLALMLSAAIMLVPRKYVLSVYIIGMCFIPAEQAVVIAGLDFKVLRILALVGILRIIIKKEKVYIRINKLDKFVIAWCVLGTIALTLNIGTFGAFVNRLGRLVDILFLYYVFRIMIRDFKDIELIIKTLLLCMIAMTPFIFIEYIQGKNLFMVLGREPTSFREGRIRCAGAFSHAILLGSFSAAVLPLAIAMSKRSVERMFSWRLLWFISIGCTFFVTIASASSGPILAMLVGIIFAMGYRFRKYLGLAFYGFLALLFILHLAMKKPVWHLVARIDVSGGSTGYHRYNLINQTINNFGDWALLGTTGATVQSWGIHVGDVTSMYILQGIDGGLATFLVFAIMIVIMCRVFWKLSLEKLPKKETLIAWGIFASAMSHAASFFSVAYFGQIQMILILWLAMAAYLLSYLQKIRREKRKLKQANNYKYNPG